MEPSLSAASTVAASRSPAIGTAAFSTSRRNLSFAPSSSGSKARTRWPAWSGASRIGLARSSHISESCEPWYPLSNVAIAPSSADTAGASALARPKRVWAAEARSTTTGPRADGALLCDRLEVVAERARRRRHVRRADEGHPVRLRLLDGDPHRLVQH